MITKKSTFFLGLIIVLLATSFIGFPSWWKAFFLSVCGLILIFMSVKVTLPSRHSSTKRPKKKEKEIRIVPESPASESVENNGIPKV